MPNQKNKVKTEKSDTWQTAFAKRWVKYWVEPARPTKSELAFIKLALQKRMRKNQELRVLVLGSTSEYRDMLIELKAKYPTIVDFSAKNYQILSGAMKYRRQYTKSERFVEDNWIKMRLREQFDVIMGDAVINVISRQDCEPFFKNMARHLKQNGIFLAKTWVRFSDVPPYTDVQIVSKFRKEIKKTDFLARVTQLFYLVDYDYKGDHCEMKKMHERMRRLYEHKFISKREWEYARKLGADVTPFRFHFPRKDWLEKKLKKYFKILARKYDDFYYPGYHPTYVLSKK